jgi:hypothetical protein
MTTARNITVTLTLTADTGGFISALEKLRASTQDLAYVFAEQIVRESEVVALDHELTMAAVTATIHNKPTDLAQAGLEARFYIRGALSPRYADQKRADRYARVLARRNIGAAVAFMLGMSERPGPATELAHTHRSWGTQAVQVVTR